MQIWLYNLPVIDLPQSVSNELNKRVSHALEGFGITEKNSEFSSYRIPDDDTAPTVVCNSLRHVGLQGKDGIFAEMVANIINDFFREKNVAGIALGYTHLQ